MENSNQTQSQEIVEPKKNIVVRQFSGFLEFIRTQGVVGFAIGFILGRAVSDLVGSLVNDIINPFVGIITGRFGDLTQMSWKVSTATVNYGKFLSLVINFVILAAIVYFVFKQLRLDKLDKPKK
jgi:large conductance mechanosensitive channel